MSRADSDRVRQEPADRVGVKPAGIRELTPAIHPVRPPRGRGHGRVVSLRRAQARLRPERLGRLRLLRLPRARHRLQELQPLGEQHRPDGGHGGGARPRSCACCWRRSTCSPPSRTPTFRVAPDAAAVVRLAVDRRRARRPAGGADAAALRRRREADRSPTASPRARRSSCSTARPRRAAGGAGAWARRPRVGRRDVDDRGRARPQLVLVGDARRHRGDDGRRRRRQLEPAVARLGHARRPAHQPQHAHRRGRRLDHRAVRAARTTACSRQDFTRNDVLLWVMWPAPAC